MGLIYYISYLFFFEHDLGKVGLLGPIFEVMELLFFTLIVVVFVCHFDDDLEKCEKCSTGIAEHTPNLIT